MADKDYIYQMPVDMEEYFVDFYTNQSFDEHWHSEIEIIYCKKGGFDAKIDGEFVSVKEGDVVCVSSGMPHALIENGQKGRSLVIDIGISLMGIEFAKLVKMQFIDKVINVKKEGMKEIHRLLEKLLAAQIAENKQDNIFLVKGLLFLLVNELMKLMEIRNPVMLRDKKLINKISGINPVIEYVEKNYMKSITVAEAASLVGYEPNYFGRCFKEVLGVGFHNYLNGHRIRIAQKLIKMDEMSIHEIGEAVGIPEPKTFSRIFKEKTGISPIKYKKGMW